MTGIASETPLKQLRANEKCKLRKITAKFWLMHMPGGRRELGFSGIHKFVKHTKKMEKKTEISVAFFCQNYKKNTKKRN